MDPDAIWGGEWGQPRNGCIRWGGYCWRGRAVLGVNLGRPIVTNGDFVAWLCESDALFLNYFRRTCWKRKLDFYELLQMIGSVGNKCIVLCGILYQLLSYHHCWWCQCKVDWVTDSPIYTVTGSSELHAAAYCYLIVGLQLMDCSYHLSDLNWTHLIWPHFIGNECAVIGCSHTNWVTACDPVCRGYNQSQFRWNEVSWDKVSPVEVRLVIWTMHNSAIQQACYSSDMFNICCQPHLCLFSAVSSVISW